MATYHLQIVTPDGLHFDGEAEKLIVRASEGDLCILAHHANFVTTIGKGEAKITVDGQDRYAACNGGMLSVTNGKVRLVPITFEWAEDIDVERAAASEAAAREKLSNPDIAPADKMVAEAKLERALARIKVAERVKK